MAYDRPYRLEYYIDEKNQDTYAIVRTGHGIICEGQNQSEMLNLIEAANEAALVDDRGR
jgi:hypothetical protein